MAATVATTTTVMSTTALSILRTASGEIGIIDCDKIHADNANSQKKWICRRSFDQINDTETIFVILDMKNRTLKTRSNAGASSYQYQFTVPRVMSFFAPNSPELSLCLVE